MKYYKDLKKISWEQLTELYGEVGLVKGFGKEKNLEKIKEAFQKSYQIVTAWDDNKLVGAGRLVSDGICYGMIFDIGVLPEYHKQGIGKEIVLNLLAGNEHLCIHLTSTFGNENFYKKLGFKQHKTAMAKYPYESEYLIYK
ncbi:MAG: GNAT family N-acetyltransferase [bacterium]|nr:GNAT family N-acetyltransferase [bacterium]